MWGAAASHFQVEGLPREFEGGLSDWSVWCDREGKIRDESSARQACEFHRLFESDIDLLTEMNLKAYRTSLNWPALLPDPPGSPGVKRRLCDKTIEFYKRMLYSLKEKDVKTFVTLFHFCLPEWIAEQGGWTRSVAVEEFTRFSELVVKELSELVDYWITINEPMAYAYQSFVTGAWPPGANWNYSSAFRCVRHMLDGHARAYAAIKEQHDSPVSFANHWRPFAPENKLNPLDVMVTNLRDTAFNHIFPRSIEEGRLRLPGPTQSASGFEGIEGEIAGLKGTMDYLGVNYYTRELSRFKLSWPLDPFGVKSDRNEYPVNSLGWEVYPDGLFDVLTRHLSAYSLDSDGRKRPVVITENGYSTRFSPDEKEGDWSLADRERCQYLISHVMAMRRAMDQGVNVTGYLHWSLTDNFEWAEGLSERFGLVRVTYPTQERTLRESGRLYAELASSNRLRIDQS